MGGVYVDDQRGREKRKAIGARWNILRTEVAQLGIP